MTDNTKDEYRNKIKEISKKTKISEIYIAKKALELATNEANDKANNQTNKKQAHIGYYLIDKGINQLYDILKYKISRQMNQKDKVKAYLLGISSLTFLIAIGISSLIELNFWTFLLVLIPSSEVSIQIIQYILSKIIKPKPIPKLDFSNGIDKENATMVVIPTIIKNKEKVQELMRKLEVFYLANQSENLYFTLLRRL